MASSPIPGRTWGTRRLTRRRIDMSRTQYVFGVIALCSLGSLMVTRAQNQKNPPQPMGFFVTSAGLGKGADLGGLAGADQHCQKLAAAAAAGSRTWHAYLSTSAVKCAGPHRERPLV